MMTRMVDNVHKPNITPMAIPAVAPALFAVLLMNSESSPLETRLVLVLLGVVKVKVKESAPVGMMPPGVVVVVLDWGTAMRDA